MTEPSFRSWLRRQEQRDDRVGDLAPGAAADWCLGKRRTVRSIKRHMLQAHEPIDAALDALERAGHQWQAGR